MNKPFTLTLLTLAAATGVAMWQARQPRITALLYAYSSPEKPKVTEWAPLLDTPEIPVNSWFYIEARGHNLSGLASIAMVSEQGEATMFTIVNTGPASFQGTVKVAQKGRYDIRQQWAAAHAEGSVAVI